jgi:hypothetical protein
MRRRLKPHNIIILSGGKITDHPVSACPYGEVIERVEVLCCRFVLIKITAS